MNILERIAKLMDDGNTEDQASLIVALEDGYHPDEDDYHNNDNYDTDYTDC